MMAEGTGPRAATPAADRRLVVLVVLVAILALGHIADHVARGDLHWPLTAQSLPLLLFTFAIVAIIGLGLALYLTGKVGPLFWAVIGGIGVAVGWLGHFSPFTGQPPRYILHAYGSAAMGWLALGWLMALMLVLIIATIYAGYLWARQREAD